MGLLLCGGKPAQAADAAPGPPDQQPSLQQPVPDTTGPIITDTVLPQATGTATIQINAFLAFTAGNFGPGWRRVGAKGDFLSLSVPVQFICGLAERTEVQIVSSYLERWAANVSPAHQSAHFRGVGDTTVELKYLLVQHEPAGPAVSGIFTAGFPTGHHRHLHPRLLGSDQLGSGAFSFTLGLNFFTYLKPFLMYSNLWYTLFTDANVNSTKTYYPDQVTLNAALEYPFAKKWVFLCEIVSTWDAGRVIGPPSNQLSTAIVSLLPALEFLPTPWLNVAAGLQVDLFGKNTKYTYTPVLVFFFNI